MNTQIVIREGVRLIAFLGCMWLIAFVLYMADTQKEQGWCDIHHATDCYDRLAVRK